jgi:hypothetical protein
VLASVIVLFGVLVALVGCVVVFRGGSVRGIGVVWVVFVARVVVIVQMVIVVFVVILVVVVTVVCIGVVVIVVFVVIINECGGVVFSPCEYGAPVFDVGLSLGKGEVVDLLVYCIGDGQFHIFSSVQNFSCCEIHKW